MTPQEKFINFLEDNNMKEKFMKKLTDEFLNNTHTHMYIIDAFIWGKDYNIWDKLYKKWKELLKEDNQNERN